MELPASAPALVFSKFVQTFLYAYWDLQTILQGDHCSIEKFIARGILAKNCALRNVSVPRHYSHRQIMNTKFLQALNSRAKD
ncbi:hypothetical protein PCC6311_1054 [Synechococcus elongatus PCC 6311]|nr:hypothetical protein M744_11665 [Synechococcus elongatus UTEX 2973]UOW70811.1 hypothetical protein PCC7943_1054 [Synechococcus elongatus PCC 7943]UOW73532.1 hypothetical protein PCC6311_1054 [Synechococcus elongatus PCC 6311]UOW76252.1 hypothetical protein PCC6301pg_1054 [Synechococcus elongatus PCC 6301]